MPKKSVAESREEYILAAKKILLEEGAGAISARRLGLELGYSYTRVYTYFDDIDTLIWQVGLSVNRDLGEIFTAYPKREGFVREDLRVLVVRYIEYHFASPNVFRLFLNQQIQEPPESILREMAEPRHNAYLQLVVEEVVRSEGKKLDVQTVSSLLQSSVYGLLAMYFGSIRVVNKETVIQRAEAFIEFILGAGVG